LSYRLAPLEELKKKVRAAIIQSAERTGDAERIRKEKERKRQMEEPIDLFGDSSGQEKEKPMVLRPDWQIDEDDLFDLEDEIDKKGDDADM
jgi:hypothetical protein